MTSTGILCSLDSVREETITENFKEKHRSSLKSVQKLPHWCASSISRLSAKC